jgi:hypothetical protein
METVVRISEGEEEEGARNVLKVLARNEFIARIIKTLLEGSEASNWDVDFPRWMQYHRKYSGKISDGSAQLGAEMASEEWMMEGVRDSMEKITETANALKEKIDVMKTERWKEIELGDWSDWREDEEKWNETLTQYMAMVDAVEMRYDLLDDSKVKYDDVIDGLVLDSETMIKEGLEIKDLLRKVRKESKRSEGPIYNSHAPTQLSLSLSPPRR